MIYALKRPKLLFRAILFINIIMPLFAALLTAVLPLPDVIRAGIL
jgi:predicted Na+-dependent transporter